LPSLRVSEPTPHSPDGSCGSRNDPLPGTTREDRLKSKHNLCRSARYRESWSLHSGNYFTLPPVTRTGGDQFLRRFSSPRLSDWAELAFSGRSGTREAVARIESFSSVSLASRARRRKRIRTVADGFIGGQFRPEGRAKGMALAECLGPEHGPAIPARNRSLSTFPHRRSLANPYINRTRRAPANDGLQRLVPQHGKVSGFHHACLAAGAKERPGSAEGLARPSYNEGGGPAVLSCLGTNCGRGARRLGQPLGEAFCPGATTWGEAKAARSGRFPGQRDRN